jgi:hypothetical protein
VVALVMIAATSIAGCSKPANAAPVRFEQLAGAHCKPAELVALAKVNDAGELVRGFNIAAAAPTGDDSNFSVKVTLGPVPSLDRLYSFASLSDARQGFTVDLGQAVGGPVFVDLAVAPDHTSGFYLAVFASP